MLAPGETRTQYTRQRIIAGAVGIENRFSRIERGHYAYYDSRDHFMTACEW